MSPPSRHFLIRYWAWLHWSIWSDCSLVLSEQSCIQIREKSAVFLEGGVRVQGAVTL